MGRSYKHAKAGAPLGGSGACSCRTIWKFQFEVERERERHWIDTRAGGTGRLGIRPHPLDPPLTLCVERWNTHNIIATYFVICDSSETWVGKALQQKEADSGQYNKKAWNKGVIRHSKLSYYYNLNEFLAEFCKKVKDENFSLETSNMTHIDSMPYSSLRLTELRDDAKNWASGHCTPKNPKYFTR